MEHDTSDVGATSSARGDRSYIIPATVDLTPATHIPLPHEPGFPLFYESCFADYDPFEARRLAKLARLGCSRPALHGSEVPDECGHGIVGSQ